MKCLIGCTLKPVSILSTRVQRFHYSAEPAVLVVRVSFAEGLAIKLWRIEQNSQIYNFAGQGMDVLTVPHSNHALA